MNLKTQFVPFFNEVLQIIKITGLCAFPLFHLWGKLTSVSYTHLGYAIITMVLSATIVTHVLPGWMSHAQTPPPDHVFNPLLPGIT